MTMLAERHPVFFTGGTVPLLPWRGWSRRKLAVRSPKLTISESWMFGRNGNWLEMSKIWEARIGKLFRFCRSAMFNNFRKCWSFFFFVFAFDISFISLEWSNYYSTCSQFLFSFDDNDSKVVSLNGWLVSNRHEYQRFGIIFCVDTKTSFLLNDQLCIYPIVQPLQNSIIFQE